MSINYDIIRKQLTGLLKNESDPLTITASFVGLLYNSLENISWCGIYVARKKELILGPFQGPIACTRIPFGKGVCGKSAKEKICLRINNVHDYHDHIICDPSAKSELVVPLIIKNKLLGVLDLDSRSINRFSKTDEEEILSLCMALISKLENIDKGFI